MNAKPALRRLFERYLSFAMARIALLLGRWIVLLAAARQLPLTQFAALAALLSAAEILRALGDLGVDSFIYARLGPASRRVGAVVKAALCMRAALSLALTLVALAAGAALLGASSGLLLLLLVPASAVQSSAVALLQKRAQGRAFIILIAGSLAASLAAAGMALWGRATATGFAGLLILADLVAASLAAWLARRGLLDVLRFAGAGRWRAVRLVRHKIAQTAAVSVMVNAYTRLDVLLVLPLGGVLAQAAYSTGFRLVEPFFQLLAISTLALLAELGSRELTGTLQLARRLAHFRLLRLLSGLSILAACLAVAAGTLSQFLLRIDPAMALTAAAIAAAIPFRLINSASAALMQRMGQFHRVMWACAINTTVIFGLGALLVQRGGAVAVAMAALFGEVLNFFVQRRALQRSITVRSLSSELSPALL